MSKYCVLNQLPAELLHLLFDYFSASELFFTLFNINDYINATLQSYSSYQLDLRTISKSDFRRICRYVRPEQVISLILSDGCDTPGQSELFFSRFHIEQFTRLRSLTIVEIELESLEFIFRNLPELLQLRSFSFDPYKIRHRYKTMDLNFRNKLERMNDMLYETYEKIFPRLYSLYLNGGWVLDSIPLPNLLYLKLEDFPINKLETITTLAPELRSLNICIKQVHMNLESIFLPSQLTRLNLKIESMPVRMYHMEILLSNRFSLKHLQLQIQGLSEIADGDRWQLLTKSLITFNFKFLLLVSINESFFKSFQTSYWVKEKQWFVAYQDRCLFSIPYFFPTQFLSSSHIPNRSTGFDNLNLYKNITKLIVNETQTVRDRFININELHLECTILKQSFKDSIDLRYISSLSILSIKNLLQFKSFKRVLPHVYKLSIKNEITSQNMEQMMDDSYEQIRKLEIQNNISNENYVINKLFRLFPSTEYFIYGYDIQSISLMIRFIDGFTHLLNASFISLGPFSNQHQDLCLDPDLIILKSNRLTYGLTICRIYHLSNGNSLYGIEWWIET